MVRVETPGQFRLKGILFGDDLWGTVLDEEPYYKNAKGVWMKKYLIIPSPQLMKAYPELQTPGALTYKNQALFVEYPKRWLIDDNPSRTNAIARIDCTFDGRETGHTSRYEKYTREIGMLEEENQNLTIANMQLVDNQRTLLGEIKSLMQLLKDIEDIRQGGKHERGEEDIPEE